MPYNSASVCACGLEINKLVSTSDRSSSSLPSSSSSRFYHRAVMQKQSKVMWEFKEGPA